MITRLLHLLKRLWPKRATASRVVTDEAISTAQGVRQRLDDRIVDRHREVVATRLEQVHLRKDIRQNFMEQELRRNRGGAK